MERVSELLNELKHWRVEGGSVLRDYHDYDHWVHWDDIKDIVNKHEKQPTLNYYQKIVLEKMKNIQKQYDISFVFEELGWLLTTGGKMKYKEFATAYESLSVSELAKVLQVFASWVLEQEEE